MMKANYNITDQQRTVSNETDQILSEEEMDNFAINCELDLGINDTRCLIRDTVGINLAAPLLMFLAGFIGNVLALVVLHRSRKSKHRTVFYTLVAALVITDLMGQILTSFMPIIVYINNRKWVGGDLTCEYHAFVMIVFGLVTPLIVCAMAVERVIALNFWFFYSTYFNHSRARILLAVLWAVVVLFASFPFFGFGHYALQYPGTWCFLNFHAEDPVGSAYAFTFAVVNILLILTIIGCNIFVTRVLLKVRLKRIRLSWPAREDGDRRSPSPMQTPCHSMESQMVLLLVAITLIFTICWAPLMIQIIINEVTHVTDRVADLTAVRLASINQILDPWLYILIRKSIILKVKRCIERIIYRLSSSARSTTSPKRDIEIQQRTLPSNKKRFFIKQKLEISVGIPIPGKACSIPLNIDAENCHLKESKIVVCSGENIAQSVTPSDSVSDEVFELNVRADGYVLLSEIQKCKKETKRHRSLPTKFNDSQKKKNSRNLTLVTS
ncbi:prostaglandin E2 receptor EP3 subtype-like [Tubulanus polymorphus]|uniref:prostaglandin E2 receptor EP3 subtype-like n=1 Tax=Tubulanus polymorphus TaxID=672921 RepID=UPI003DA42FDA